ncbi:MAG TPA: hypothetical protein VKM55_16995 [Candidatus Lokiarchaeia archaeon]|nr:hypothetical protein [Candidatus Lokiarchaeia archaeon]
MAFARHFLDGIKADVRRMWQLILRNLRNDWHYKFKLLLNSLYTLINLALFSVLAEVVQPKLGAMPPEYYNFVATPDSIRFAFLKFLFVGTYFWAIFTHPFEDTVQCLTEEQQKGTIGLLLTNGNSITAILMGRFWASFILSFFLATAVVVPFFFLLGLVTVDLIVSIPWILIVMATMTLFMLCASLWAASFSLLFKKTGVLSDVFVYGLKVATGMYFPIFGLGHTTLVLESIPVASGMDFIRDLFIVGYPVSHGGQGTGFGWQPTIENWLGFIVQSQVIGVIVLVAIAIVCIVVFAKKAKLRGSIETY